MDISQTVGRGVKRRCWRDRPLLPWIFTLHFLLAPAVSPPVAGAQEAVPKPGDRIRVTTSVLHYGGGNEYLEKNHRYVGSLVELGPQYMRWDSDGSPYNTPLDQVAKLELVRGQKSNAGKGALIGLLAGGLGGFGFGVLACEGWSANCLEGTSTGSIALVTAVLGAAGGAGIGALIGLASKTDRWSEVPSSVYKGGATKVARRSR